MEGIKYLLIPDFNRFFDLNLWLNAANQAVFVLGLGAGPTILFSKYKKQTDSILLNSYLINTFIVIFGIICCAVNFSFLGNLSLKLDTPIDNLPVNGSDLAFVTYPAIISTLPYPNLWSIIFYTMLITLGLNTQVRIK